MTEILKELHFTELEILEQVDRFCTEHGIRYSLYAGTLLGAVRHHGFIPWDDDLDICMPRKDYDRFIELWMKKAPEGYILQNKENSPEFTQSFTKIRKDNTTFLQQGEEDSDYHTGIFIDVFPIDRMPNGMMKKMVFTYRCMLYLLFTREFVPPKDKSTGIQRFLSMTVLKITSHEKRIRKRNQLLDKIIKYNENTSLAMISTATIAGLKFTLSPDYFEHLIKIPFENSLFSCSEYYDQALKTQYKDYMKLPPKEQQAWKHHPLILDFQHNYEDVKDK